LNETKNSAGPRRVLIVFNPTAGARRRKRLRDVLDALAARGCIATVRETRAPGDATLIAAAARRDDFEVIAAAGGDGTLNEVVNGLGAAAPAAAVMPFGTANVAALELGIGADAAAIAGLIADGEAAPAWLGRVGGRRFVVMAGVGFDAHVVESVTPRLKRRLGRGAFVWRSAVELARYRLPTFVLTVDGETMTAASAIVANGRYYAGPYVCAPAAGLDRPGLQLCLFERAGRAAVARYGLALLTGRLAGAEGYRVVPAGRIEIAGPAGEPVQADGELAARLPVVIESTGEQVMLLRPKAPAGRC